MGILNINLSIFATTLNKMMNQIRILRTVGVAEGISFLVLLLIAMPLKHFFSLPIAVKVVGWLHGILFLGYIVVVPLSIRAMKWRIRDIAIALFASLVPFGTLVLDRSWKKRASSQKTSLN
jgi:integral membrane protein